MNPRTLSVPAAVLLLLAGCGDDRIRGDQRTGAVTDEEIRRAREQMPPAVLSALDSGNAAYRRGEMDAALAHYRRATDQDPDVAAAWFGIYMVERARGDAVAARRALVKAYAASPDASLIEEKKER